MTNRIKLTALLTVLTFVGSAQAKKKSDQQSSSQDDAGRAPDRIISTEEGTFALSDLHGTVRPERGFALSNVQIWGTIKNDTGKNWESLSLRVEIVGSDDNAVPHLLPLARLSAGESRPFKFSTTWRARDGQVKDWRVEVDKLK